MRKCLLSLVGTLVTLHLWQCQSSTMWKAENKCSGFKSGRRWDEEGSRVRGGIEVSEK